MPAEETSGHLHTEDCYDYVLVCQLPEHSHDETCYADMEIEEIEEPDNAGAEIEEPEDETDCQLCRDGVAHGHASAGAEAVKAEAVKTEEPLLGNQPMAKAAGFMGIMATSASDTWDLFNFVNKTTIYDKDNHVVNPATDIFYYGDTYTFEINFLETLGTNGQFEYNGDGFLEYQLPDVLQVIEPVTDGVIYYGNSGTIIVGEYEIDVNGHVKVKFYDVDNKGDLNDENFIYIYTDVNFSLNIAAKFVAGAEGGDVFFGTDAIITITLKHEDPMLDVKKAATGYDSNAETVKYSITISAPLTNKDAVPSVIKGIELTDTPRIGSGTNNSNYLNSATDNIYSEIKYTYRGAEFDITDSVDWIKGSGSERTRLYYKFPSEVELEPGEMIILTYTVDLKKIAEKNSGNGIVGPDDYEYSLYNTVNVKSDSLEKRAETYRSVKKKTTLNQGKTAANYAQTITYTASVTMPPDNVGSVTVTKFIDKPWIASSSGAGDNARISITDIEAAYTSIEYRYRITNSNAWSDWKTIDSSSVIWHESETNGPDRAYFEFDFDPSIELQPGGGIEVRYTLNKQILIDNNYQKNPPIRSRLQHTFYISNQATFKSNLGDTNTNVTNTQVAKTFTVSKTGERTSADKIKWTITIGTSANNNTIALNGETVTDTLEVAGGGTINFPNLAEISIRLYPASGSSIALTAADFAPTYFSVNGREFKFTIPQEEEMINGTPIPKIYRAEIIYSTSVAIPPAGSTYRYRNNVKFDIFNVITPYIEVGPPTLIDKKGDVENKDDPANRYITWTATVGDGSAPLIGTITDTLDLDLSFPDHSGITVKLYYEPKGVWPNIFTGSTTIITAKADQLSDYFTFAGNVFNFKIPEKGDLNPISGETFDDIYRVEFEYKTAIDPDIREKTRFNNKIKFNNELTVYVDVPEVSASNPTVTKVSYHPKESQTNPGEYEIEYEINLTVPAWSIGGNIFIWDQISPAIAGFSIDMIENLSVTLDSQLPGEPDLLYKKIAGSGSIWYIIFGSENGTTTSASTWQYDTKKIVTIKYTLSLDHMVANDLTIKEYLESNYSNTLTNTVRSYNKTYFTSYTVTDAWPIHKTGTVSLSDDAIIDYTVTLNGNGNRYSLFKAGEPAIFTDTFDSQLEYVPGSFYVYTSSDGRYYGPYNTSKVDMTDTSVPDTISVDFSDMGQFNTWNGSVANSSLRELGPQISNWYTANNTQIVIRYQLRLKDPNTPADIVLLNDATIDSTTLDRKFSNHAKVTTKKNNPLTKRMVAENGTDVADVEIFINPLGRRLREKEDDDNWFKAIDEMSETLAFFMNTIEIYVPGEVPGSWRPVTDDDKLDTGSGRLFEITGVSSRLIEIIIPDETPIKITYQARILLVPGETGEIQNTISVFGNSASDGKSKYEVQTSNANATAGKQPLLIFKSDEDDNTIALDGAKFELWMAIPQGGYYGTGDPIGPPPINKGDYEFYWVQDATFEGNGRYMFDSNLLTPSHEAVYMIIETEFPSGYQTTDDPCTFFILHSGANIAEINDKLGSGYEVTYASTSSVYITNKAIEPIDIIIDGHKSITGINQEDVEETFAFELVEVEQANAGDWTQWKEKAGGYMATQYVKGAGDFSFDLIGLEEGIYYYKITELAGDSTLWSYDQTIYIVEVIVEIDKNDQNKLIAYISYDFYANGKWFGQWPVYFENSSHLDFINDYIAVPKLPETGGIGTFAFGAIGLVVMLLSGSSLMIFKKKSKKS
ncbi:MAG: LPXTG cell wall anchor domain-containing protein [Oscillospiraceae bacterium]|nr:LPXTG cell wall anchor domain-containing protein [Oscillospiraceae bacterium]